MKREGAMKSLLCLLFAALMLSMAGARYRLGEWQWIPDLAAACGWVAAASDHNERRAR